MSTKRVHPSSTSRYYQVTVEGMIPGDWSEWLNGMEISTQKETSELTTTTLRGFIIDQAALRGLLNRLWDLNLVLRSLQAYDLENMSDPE